MEKRDDPNAPSGDVETLVGDDGRRARRGLLVPADEAPTRVDGLAHGDRSDALPDVLGLLGEHTPVPLQLDAARAVAESTDPSLTAMALPPPPTHGAISYPTASSSSSSMRVVRRKIRKLGGAPESDVPPEPTHTEPSVDDPGDSPTAPRLPRLAPVAEEARPAAKGSPLVVAVSRTPVPPIAKPVSLELIKPTPIPSPPVPRIHPITVDDFTVPEAEAPPLLPVKPASVPASAEPTVTHREPPPRKPPSIPPGSRPAIIASPLPPPVPPPMPLTPVAGVDVEPELEGEDVTPVLAAHASAPDGDGVELSLEDGAEVIERLSVPDELAMPAGDEQADPRAARGMSLPPPPPPDVAKLPPRPPSRTAAVTVVEAKRKRRYWWEELFSEDYFRTLPRLDREQVRAEVDWIEHALGTEGGAAILDLACGPGHHAVEFALRRYELTGLDLSPAMIGRATESAAALGADVRWAQLDMVQMDFEDAFDAAYCVGTSFGLFDDERNAEVARRLHRALKPHGTFLLQVLNRDHVIQRQPAMAWFEGDGCVCMEETSFNFITSRLNVKRTMIFDDGRQREIEYSIRLYSLHELGQVLHQAGFRILEVSGHRRTPGAFFGATSRELIILAQKRGAEVVEIPSAGDVLA